jgi:hypothetical protein
MAKVIAEKAASEIAVAGKQVEIKHTKVMKNSSGNNVTVVDWTDVKPVDTAISEAEAQLVDAEALVVDLKADIVAYKAIKG